jgi:hypothetical protein
MKALVKVFFICSLFLFQFCTKQSIDIDVVEVACRNFTLDRPSYHRLSDPCQGGTTASFDVTFTYRKGDDNCLASIDILPDFYDSIDQKINNVVFKPQLLKSDTEVAIDSINKTVSFRFDVEFANLSDADNFNHLILKFNTRTEANEPSNSLELRMIASCAVVTPGSYTTNSQTATIPPNANCFEIKLWDNGSEDGDIVSVYLNSVWIYDNLTLKNDGDSICWPVSILNTGTNDLVVFAINEGTSGPNTVAIAINDVEIQNFSPGMLTGEAVQINF